MQIMLNDYQTSLINKWENLIEVNNNAYISDVIRIIKEETDRKRLIEILPAFYEMENRHNIFKSDDSMPDYEEIFSCIRDNLFVYGVLNNQLEIIYFKIVELINESNLKLVSSPKLKEIYSNILIRYYNIKDPFDKITTASLLYLIQVFSGDSQNAKKEFIERLSNLNLYELTFKQDVVIETVNFLIQSIFNKTEELLLLSRQITFNEEEFFKRDIDVQKSNFMLVIHFFWRNNGAEKIFCSLYKQWVRLYHKAIEHNLAELVFYMHFPVSHIYMNTTQTQDEWKKMNDDIEIPLSTYIREKLIPDYSIEQFVYGAGIDKKTIKVGFVYDRVVMNTPFVVLYSLLKDLIENKKGEYEFYVYDIVRKEQSESDPQAVEMIRKLGVNYISNHNLIDDASRGLYYSHFDKCLRLRKKIIEDKIDIMIVENNVSQFNFLLSTRTAPVQIYWSHGNFMYETDGIDLKISHYTSYCPYKKEYNYNLFNVPLAERFLNPPVDLNKVNGIRRKFPHDHVILGSIARLIKLDNREFLSSLAEIMRLNPNTVFLACGVGGTEEIRQEIRRLGIENRFYFEGYIDQHIYGHVIDVMLDTFPAPLGVAKDEFAAKGGCIVIHGEYNNYALVDKYIEYFRQKGFREEEIPVAFNNENYVRIANIMIRDTELRKRAGVAYKEFISSNMDGKEFFNILQAVSCNNQIFTLN